MPRRFSTRRFILAYAAATVLLVLLVANFFHYRYYQQQQRLTHVRLGAVQRLVATARREMPEDRFFEWLGSIDLRSWAASGWNAAVLAPDSSVRWSIHPIAAGGFDPQIRAAIQDLDAAPGGILRRTWRPSGGRPHALHLQHLLPGEARAGMLLLYAPLPRFFLDAHDLWAASAILIALLIGALILYHFLLLRHVRQLASAAGLADVAPPRSEPIEQWAQQYLGRASRKFAEERDQFDALFDLFQDGTLFLDGEDRILRANATAAALLSEDQKGLAGRRLAELPDHAALEELVGEIRATGVYQASDIQLKALPSLCNVAGILLRAGPDARRGHAMLVLRDVSRLRQLERAGEDYATNVSHELKTPLTLILGHTETLISHADMEPEFRDHSLRTIERHAKRILRIIDDLLRLAWLRNEAGTVRVPRAIVAIGPVVEEAVGTCREWARAAGIDIETRIPDGLSWSLNAGLIEEALVNLVKNAILYALVGPVEIHGRVLENGHLELAVTDRGPGLRPEDAQRIFDRFYRADKGRSRASGGSGLGLPIVQQIVEAHRGTARVETAPGAGCTFILKIPPGSEPGPA